MPSPLTNMPNFCATLLHTIRESAHVRRHIQLLQWLQGDVQTLLPHDILIAAWGDFSLGLVQLDIVSAIPGVRTRHVGEYGVMPLVRNLFAHWDEGGRRPANIDASRYDWAATFTGGHEMTTALRRLRTATVHGIKDERGRHDCLYIALAVGETNAQRQREMMEILLPHIDMAMRQVPMLPAPASAAEDESPADDDSQLSARELEIMEWVRLGKTNYEIGVILNISTFTVKNHMRRILRRLDVINRAQAASRVEQMLRPAARREGLGQIQ